MKSLKGNAPWRPFRLAFYMNGQDGPGPEKIEFSVVLPGQGTVFLGPMRLVEYGDSEDPFSPAGQWWGGRTGGLIGGIVGVVMGIVGGLIGILGGRGRAKRVVWVLLGVMLLVSVAALVIGVAALLSGQPYAVYYPMLLVGAICGFVSLSIRPVMRRRYEQAELQKMNAQDAVPD